MCSVYFFWRETKKKVRGVVLGERLCIMLGGLVIFLPDDIGLGVISEPQDELLVLSSAMLLHFCALLCVCIDSYSDHHHL